MSVEERLERIEALLAAASKEVLNSAEAAALLGITAKALRNLTAQRKVPHYKQGASLYFRKSELEAWRCARRVPTDEEVASQAAALLRGARQARGKSKFVS